ncbi:hypothetical protein IKE79_00020 [Candidatus Saccharibacteria bacterium]|nr:hypothetical protein [Candidatus Saccharibacteria bacterium]
MLRTVTIVPAILTADLQDFQAQIARVGAFTKHIQIDITDGVFAKNRTLDIANVAWPEGWTVDLHLMVSQPSKYLDTVMRLKPAMCIFHAEAGENLLPIFAGLKAGGIKAGVAMVPSTFPGRVKPYIDAADHALIFAGQLGVQGSPADMMQMEKIPIIRQMKQDISIGWDGGANMTNMRALTHADLDIINVGSAISRAPDPAAVYAEMVAEIDKTGVTL